MSAIAKVMELAGISPVATSVSNDQLEQARAIAFTLGRDSAIETIRATAVATARARLAAIITHPEAAGREALAHQLAFDTDLPADAAITALRVSAKVIPLRRSRLDGNVPDPKVSAFGGFGDDRGLENANDAATFGLNSAVDRAVQRPRSDQLPTV